MIATTDNGGAQAVDEVLLDGVVQHAVVYADDCNGFVVCHKLNEQRRLIIREGKVVSEARTGKVEIRLFPGFGWDEVSRTFKGAHLV
jgi:hypothetical protein